MCNFLSLCGFVANLRASRVDRSATIVGFRSDWMKGIHVATWFGDSAWFLLLVIALCIARPHWGIYEISRLAGEKRILSDKTNFLQNTHSLRNQVN
uniref:Uncharacterized protein n=1 Tax=Onchocerca volvulus TaxID=6282 RepID=A0A8R1TT89_ONCVO